MIVRLEHTALSVADLDRSLAFYRDLIGFKVVRVLEASPGEDLGKITAMAGARARIAHLELGEAMLELFEYRAPRGRPIPPDRRQADHGWIHMGLKSDDVPGDYERLGRIGVEFLGEPVQFRAGVWVVYFHGPDGEVCELRQT